MAGTNRYSRKRRHKRIMKKKYLMHHGYRTNEAAFLEEYSRYPWPPKSHRNRNDGYTYWDDYTFSKRRRFAKQSSDRRVRQRYRNLLSDLSLEDLDLVCDVLEDVRALRHAEYQDLFDYAWEIW